MNTEKPEMPEITGYRSVARWPRGFVNLGDPNNESTDDHATEEFALAVCRILERDGFGGDGKIFPISTRVEPIYATRTPIPATRSEKGEQFQKGGDESCEKVTMAASVPVILAETNSPNAQFTELESIASNAPVDVQSVDQGQAPPAAQGEKGEEGYKDLGDFSATPPWHSRRMSCDKCRVTWLGCWDNFQCPQCGEGELPSDDLSALVAPPAQGEKGEARKWRKKPVEVEALCFDGSNAQQCTAFIGEESILRFQYGEESPGQEYFKIKTLEGDMKVSIGDFIIKGIQGEFYPCKPDIFADCYEPVSAPPAAQGESICKTCQSEMSLVCDPTGQHDYYHCFKCAAQGEKDAEIARLREEFNNLQFKYEHDTRVLLFDEKVAALATVRAESAAKDAIIEGLVKALRIAMVTDLTGNPHLRKPIDVALARAEEAVKEGK